MTVDSLPPDFVERLLLNSAVLLILLRFVYFRFSPDRDSLAGFFLFGHGVYLVCSLMHNIDISMGFAFGLFAVLSMLRYRTESISIRDMTYLFLVTVVSLLSAVGPVDIVYLTLLNSLLCLITMLSETTLFAPRTTLKTVVYDNTVNIKAENRSELIQDLQNRMGSTVLDVEVLEVDFIKDSVRLRVTVAAADRSETSINVPNILRGAAHR